MRKTLQVIIVLGWLSTETSLTAGIVTFFGEDVNLTGDPNVATPANSNVARANFFSNLTGVGTETFEGFSTGAVQPFTVVFPGAGTATLSGGGGFLDSGINGFGEFPISGTKYVVTAAGGTFTITFSAPISAFGFYGTDIGDGGASLILGLSGGATTSLPVDNTVGTFTTSTSGSVLYFGFYDTTDTYTSISFNNNARNDVFGFDDFSVGTRAQITPAPEPTSTALTAAGLWLLILIRARLVQPTPNSGAAINRAV